MRAAAAILLGIALGAAAQAAQLEGHELSIVDRLLPKVKNLQETGGVFVLADPIPIATDQSASDATLRTARILDVDLRCATGRAVDLASDPDTARAIVLRVTDGTDPEAYHLSVTSRRVVITGCGEPGLFYGARTLLQLIENARVPCCEIGDSPDYKRRMVHYDLAREQTCNLKHLKRVIDVLSDHKINMLHLYFENRFQFDKHPKVSPPGVMTREQAVELDEYARTRFVELVPEVNCLAHLENALCVENYRRFAEDPDNPYEICTQNPEAVAFVEDMVRELAACFKSKYFHMGGDESSQMGTCPKCAERIEQDGGKQNLFAGHYTHVAEFIKSLGKRPMMWGDMLLRHRGAAEMMPKDIIIFDWHYGETSVQTVKYFTSQGFDVYVCPAMSGFSRLAAPYNRATGNIYKFIGEGMQGGAIGECTCAWELRLGHFFTNDYWGILLSADRSWNIGAGDLADYEKRFCKEFFGLDDLRPITYYRELGDGCASVFEHVVPPNSWIAFGPQARGVKEDFGSKITCEILAASEEKLKELTAMLDDLRASVTRNGDTLEFADLPAHSAHMMLRKLAFFYQADQLIEDARRERESGPAANSKLANAIDLLEQIDKDQQYFERRFQDAVERYGGSQADIARVRNIRAGAAARIAEARSLLSE